MVVRMWLTCLYSASLVKLFGKEFTDNKCPFGRNFRWLPNDSRFSQRVFSQHLTPRFQQRIKT